MNAYYNKVDELCKEKNITHRELAEEVGVSEVTLSRYLRCDRKTELCTFMAICRTLDITPENLYNTYLYARLEMRIRKYRELERRRVNE